MKQKFIVIPRDAFELLLQRHGTLAEATGAGTQQCAETGQASYVVEVKAVAQRADRPVKVVKV